MREILFRGKTNPKCNGINSIWVYGHYYKVVETSTGIYVDAIQLYREDPFYEDPYFTVAVIPETVGQFTGLTDKNGKKIFEGDIVKIEDMETYAKMTFQICFGRVFQALSRHIAFDSIGFYTKTSDGSTPFILQHNAKSEEAIEIIGNIHDNPEL